MHDYTVHTLTRTHLVTATGNVPDESAFAAQQFSLMVLFVLEEKFALAVCFLLVDLYLLTYQPEKALHLLAVLEKLSVQGNNKNGKGEVRVPLKRGVLACTILGCHVSDFDP